MSPTLIDVVIPETGASWRCSAEAAELLGLDAASETSADRPTRAKARSSKAAKPAASEDEKEQ